jgi:hypothetical protein
MYVSMSSYTLYLSSLPQVQHVVPEVTISPEVTPENVTTYIVDSGGKSSDQVTSFCTHNTAPVLQPVQTTSTT